MRTYLHLGILVVVVGVPLSALAADVKVTDHAYVRHDGASDAVSVVIRHSLVQTRTPQDMLGRVMAVNALGTGSSGTLGEFESGLLAAWFGAVTSALVGGVGALAIVVLWMLLFPRLRQTATLAPQH